MDLFRRFKKDRKFKRAGEGHRLGVEGASQGQPASASSSSSSASTARNASASGRQQPREMSQAARAAQERMQRAQQTGRPNTSSAIKSEARRQVQAEAASSGTQPSTATPSRDQPAGQWKQEADRLQVQVVCPITGNLVRERDKTDHLRRELTQRLTEMPVPMAAKMVWTLNSREKRELAVKTICAYINNVLQHPDEPKYRRINKENKAFQARILGAEGALEFLKAVGFEEENGEEDGKTFLALPEGVSTDELTTAKDVISSDQTIICRLHRDVRVLKPPRGAAIAAAMRVDLPSDFYKLTVDDLRSRQQQLQSEKDKMETLRTQAMRDAELAQGQKQYRFCLIRVRFPDGLILQGTFHAVDRVSTLRKFVQDSLADEGRAFYLFTHPDRTKIENANDTLRQAGLVPLRLLNFAWADGEMSKKPVIKQSLLDTMQILS